MEGAPPDELKRLVKRSVPHYVQNSFRHPQRPDDPYDFYDTKKENYFRYLVDVPNDSSLSEEERIAEAKSPLFPDNWADINVLRFARGCLKTWSCSSVAAWSADVFPGIEVDVTAPKDQQKDEVVDRIKQRVEESGLDECRVRDNINHQKFDRGNSYSHIKARTGFGGGDSFRGLHGEVGILDETQDADSGLFTNFLEAVDGEMPDVDYFPTIFVIGTPKMTGTFFHRLSNVAETWSWDGDEQAWKKQSDGEGFMPPEARQKADELRDEMETLQDSGDDYESEVSALQEQLDALPRFSVREWHIDQYNSPKHDPARLAFKKQDYSEKRFQNEVLAQFYSADDDLLSREHVEAAWLENESLRETPLGFEDGSTVLGVDWGGGKGEGSAETVIVVSEYDAEEDTVQLLNIDILDSSVDPDGEKDRIDTLMMQYDVDIAVVDEGYGDTERHDLRESYGHENLYGCRFGNVSNKEDLKWNRYNNDEVFFTVNKSYVVKQFCQFFVDGNYRIPRDGLDFDSRTDAGTKIIDHLTSPYTDRSETRSGKKKTVVKSDRPDDVFDAFVYSWLAAKKVYNDLYGRKGNLTVPVTNDRKTGW